MKDTLKDMLALVPMVPLLIVLACHSRTALEVESCFESSVASAAAKIMGNVSGIVLSSSSIDDAKRDLTAIATTNGIAATICALDTLLGALGRESLPATNDKMARTATPAHDATHIAIARGHALRIALTVKK